MLSLSIHYEYFIKKYIPHKANVYEFLPRDVYQTCISFPYKFLEPILLGKFSEVFQRPSRAASEGWVFVFHKTTVACDMFRICYKTSVCISSNME